MATDKFNAAALRTPEGVKELMASSTSETEWNDNCDSIKEANGGDYPDFWLGTVMMSGLYGKVSAKFQP